MNAAGRSCFLVCDMIRSGSEIRICGVSKMSDSRLKGIAVILFGILLSASSAEMNRTVLASFSDFPFALVGIIVGIVGLVMVFKSNKE